MNFRGRGYFDRRNGEFSIGVDKRESPGGALALRSSATRAEK
jgi:hypothetical protein